MITLSFPFMTQKLFSFKFHLSYFLLSHPLVSKVKTSHINAMIIFDHASVNLFPINLNVSFTVNCPGDIFVE